MFQCNFSNCNNKAVYRLDYAYEKDSKGNLIHGGRPDYTEFRCEEHVLIKTNHPSCGLPETIHELHNDKFRQDLVEKLKD